jgi:tetratricopeptide (TPR) repeat protein
MSKRNRGRPPVTPAPAAARMPSGRTIAVIALILLVVAVYAPVRQYPFVNFDDAEYVSENAHVLAGLTAETVKWAATANAAGNWHPVTMLSHALVVEMFGPGPEPQHIVNAALHLANTLLLFGVLISLTGAIGRSFFVAAVFAVHPIHVESVAWISERKDVLSTFFWLLALWMYLVYVRRPRLGPYLGLLAFFALALMSKPMAVTLPLVLLLIDVWPLERLSEVGRPPKSLVLEKLPLVALALIAGFVTLVFQSRVGAVASLDIGARVAGSIEAYVLYLVQAIWPMNLSPFYPPHATPLWMAVAGAAGLIVVTMAVIRARARWPFLLVGWFWYLIVLLPTIGIVKAGEQARADRYMYLPLVGILLIVAWGVPELLKRWSSDAVGRGLSRTRMILPALVALVLIGAVPVARAQVSYWSDSVALWRRATSVTTNNRRGYENLGQALRERNQLTEAYAAYERALEVSSAANKAPIYNAMGLVATRQGRMPEAIANFQSAIAIDARFAEAQTNLGNALAGERRPAEALSHFRAALALEPDSAESHLGLAGVLAALGQQDEARSQYQEAIRLNPRMAEAHAGFGTALAQAGDLDGAIRALTEALRLNPNLVNANLNLGLILAQKGDREDAIRYLEQALRLAPALTVARDALAALRR